jgi:hypothetical protein
MSKVFAAKWKHCKASWAASSPTPGFPAQTLGLAAPTQGLPFQLQEPPLGQQISLTRQRYTHHPLVPSPTWSPGTKVYAALRLPPAEKLRQRPSTAAHVCTPSNGRLFVTDRISKRRFLVDIGSDLACTPAGSFHDARNVSTTTFVQLTALLTTPMDGCLSASTSVYAGISRGDS